jgi:hypothetical protein
MGDELGTQADAEHGPALSEATTQESELRSQEGIALRTKIRNAHGSTHDQQSIAFFQGFRQALLGKLTIDP